MSLCRQSQLVSKFHTFSQAENSLHILCRQTLYHIFPIRFGRVWSKAFFWNVTRYAKWYSYITVRWNKLRIGICPPVSLKVSYEFLIFGLIFSCRQSSLNNCTLAGTKIFFRPLLESHSYTLTSNCTQCTLILRADVTPSLWLLRLAARFSLLTQLLQAYIIWCWGIPSVHRTACYAPARMLDVTFIHLT